MAHPIRVTPILLFTSHRTHRKPNSSVLVDSGLELQVEGAAWSNHPISTHSNSSSQNNTTIVLGLFELSQTLFRENLVDAIVDTDLL
jgi:hypothetical protein